MLLRLQITLPTAVHYPFLCTNTQICIIFAGARVPERLAKDQCQPWGRRIYQDHLWRYTLLEQLPYKYAPAATSSWHMSIHGLLGTGSVTGANCKELAAKPDVDGFLVGGASLKVTKNPGRQLMSCSLVNQRYYKMTVFGLINNPSCWLFLLPYLVCSLSSLTSSTQPPWSPPKMSHVPAPPKKNRLVTCLCTLVILRWSVYCFLSPSALRLQLELANNVYRWTYQ